MLTLYEDCKIALQLEFENLNMIVSLLSFIDLILWEVLD